MRGVQGWKGRGEREGHQSRGRTQAGDQRTWGAGDARISTRCEYLFLRITIPGLEDYSTPHTHKHNKHSFGPR